MFGYVNVDKSNLLGKDFDTYRAIYCSLCKQLGRDYSIFARFFLNYDCTFYAVLMLSLSDKTCDFCTGRCRFNPLKKCDYISDDTVSLSLAAALTISSAYYKLLDNILDSPWYKRIFYRLLQPMLSSWHKISLKKFPTIDNELNKMTISQKGTEEDKNCNIDKAAEPTAAMLSAVFSLVDEKIDSSILKKNKNSKRILSSFGYFLGKWIYLIDAADDYFNDKKHHNFNPYITLDVEEKELKNYVLSSLNHTLSEAMLSYNLLEKGRYDAIISNALFSALPKKQNLVLSKFDKPDKQK